MTTASPSTSTTCVSLSTSPRNFDRTHRWPTCVVNAVDHSALELIRYEAYSQGLSLAKQGLSSDGSDELIEKTRHVVEGLSREMDILDRAIATRMHQSARPLLHEGGCNKGGAVLSRRWRSPRWMRRRSSTCDCACG